MLLQTRLDIRIAKGEDLRDHLQSFILFIVLMAMVLPVYFTFHFFGLLVTLKGLRQLGEVLFLYGPL